MENQHTPQLVSLRGLASRLRRFGLTLAWLQAEAEAGRIPCMRAEKRWLFNVEAVEEALLRRAAEGESRG